jgi:hypothetical protein
MPPLGLITVAALCPPEWSIRLVDQNFEELRPCDFHDMDLVMVSGMRVQADAMHDILLMARTLGKRTIVGGPYASSRRTRRTDVAYRRRSGDRLGTATVRDPGKA